jgi:hypothetical protein
MCCCERRVFLRPIDSGEIVRREPDRLPSKKRALLKVPAVVAPVVVGVKMKTSSSAPENARDREGTVRREVKPPGRVDGDRIDVLAARGETHVAAVEI